MIARRARPLALLLALACASEPAVSGEAARPVTATDTAGTGSIERSRRAITLYSTHLAGIGYDRGDPAAPVVVVDFSDFGCPYCGSHARQTLPALEQEYIETGKVFYKYVPFVMGMFPNGDLAARAAECAAEEQRFWPMHDRLYEDQNGWKRSDAPASVFRAHAAALGLDSTRFAGCMAEGHTDPRTARATAAATRLRIRATPTFFIDGQAVEGALPLDAFRRLIEERLAAAGRR